MRVKPDAKTSIPGDDHISTYCGEYLMEQKLEIITKQYGSKNLCLNAHQHVCNIM